MAHWLIKSEPFKYSWDQLVADGRTFWNGVRNYQARNYLMEMQLGDLCLFYHSNEGKAVMGIAEVVRTHYPDPTVADDERAGNWVVVDVAPHTTFAHPVPLAALKADADLRSLNIFKQMRLSVVSVSPAHFDKVVAMGMEGITPERA